MPGKDWWRFKGKRRVAKQPSPGFGRLGANSREGSGDIFVAFSTANPDLINENEESQVAMYPNNGLSDVFKATVQATEEAIVNAMVAADTVIGASGLRVRGLPKEEVRAIFHSRK